MNKAKFKRIIRKDKIDALVFRFEGARMMISKERELIVAISDNSQPDHIKRERIIRALERVLTFKQIMDLVGVELIRRKQKGEMTC